MRLSQASDFSFRILMLLDTEPEPMTVDEIAKRLQLVKSHVMKIVSKLAKAGFITSHRGRGGGVSLGQKAGDISLGDVVRLIENDFAIVSCMQEPAGTCVFSPACKLRGVMANAQQAFMDVLDKQTLKSIAFNPMDFLGSPNESERA
ncbi:MAG: Rrf2 family transcriptional regulator [Hyphomicrobiales bacterium]